ncbi:MAG: type II secretion system protein [Elusimicrobia bacterium]|nr:type II secretion system protein [Elusimicrobiota bacterium]
MVNYTMKKIKFRKGFTLPELMLIVAVAGILIISGSLKFIQLRDNIRIDRMKAQMKVLQIGLKMYYADVGLFPIAGKTGGGLGGYSAWDNPASSYNTAHWQDYLMFGYKPGWEPGDPAPTTDSDEDKDPRDGWIDNWHGKYVDSPNILSDPWGHRFLYTDYTWTTMKKSGILCMGPQGPADGTKFGYDTSPGFSNYLRSNGTPFSWAAGTKDITDPPDEEGFSVFYRDGDPANEKTDFIAVLWME